MEFRPQLRSRASAGPRILAALLALTLFALLAALGTTALLLYHILGPHPAPELSAQSLLGAPTNISFTVPSGETRQGLFYPGRRGGPVVILCHGYHSHGRELLTLSAVLQENQYNVFLFNFSGHGSGRSFTSLGYREAEELAAAIEAVAQRDDVDRSRLGLWGADLGAYAALAVAARDPRVRVLVLDAVYESPEEMLRFQVDHSGLGRVPAIQTLCRWGFRLVYSRYRHEPPLGLRMASLEGVAKLFVRAPGSSALDASAERLFQRSPEPREQMITAKAGYVSLLDSDKRAYEKNVLRLFLQYLPPVSRAR